MLEATGEIDSFVERAKHSGVFVDVCPDIVVYENGGAEESIKVSGGHASDFAESSAET